MTTRRAVLLALLALSIVLLFVALLWEPDAGTAEGPTTGLNVMVLAVDGLDWFLVGEYMEAGRMPNTNRIFRSAVTGEMEADEPALPHVGWTVMARGAPLTDSELSLVGNDGAGRLFGVVPELVRLVNRQGGDAVAFGWPGAWPLPEGQSDVVAPYTPGAPDHVRTIAPALFQGATGQVEDPDLYETVERAVGTNLEELAVGFAEDVHSGGCGVAGADEGLLGVIWGYLADITTLDIAGREIALGEPDLALVYMGGLDAASHRFLASAMPDYFEGVETSAGTCADVVPNYYTFVDDAVGRLLRLADENTIFLLVSAYGTHPSLDSPPATGGHGLGPPGVMLERGPRLAGRGQQLFVTTADVAPTLLAGLGLSIPPGMTGRVVPEMLPAGLLDEHPPRFTEGDVTPLVSTEAPPESGKMQARVDSRMAELRSLLP